MKNEDFLNNIRQEIRENGFMSEQQVYMLIKRRAEEFEIDVFADNILKNIPCDDIRVVKYTNWTTPEHRAKDLYYFQPIK